MTADAVTTANVKMTCLIACVDDAGKSIVEHLAKPKLFSDVILVIEPGMMDFCRPLSTSIIVTDFSMPIDNLHADILSKLKKALGDKKILDLDIALNFASGSGKVHEALLASLLKLGYGIRIVDLDKDNDVAEL